MSGFNSVEKIIFSKFKSRLSKDEKNIETQCIYNDSSVKESLISNNFREISNNIEKMERTRENYAYRLVLSNKKYIGKIIIFIKKSMRKSLKWYIEPICFQQTDFNNAVTPSIGRLLENQSILENQIAKSTYRIQELEVQSNNTAENPNVLIMELKSEILSIKQIFENQLSHLSTDIINVESTLENRLILNEKNESFLRAEYVNINDRISNLEEFGLAAIDEKKFNMWEKYTYSQAGEDAIILYILTVMGIDYSKCTYLDLGANHAKELSNTYFLYKHGAKGVLVEANKNLIPELKFYRNRDIVLNKCVALESNQEMEFYILSGDGLSTTEADSVNEFKKINADIEVSEVVKVQTITVNDIIDQYLGIAPTVISIDVEGKDFEILKSIDYSRFRPLIIITEMIEYSTYLSINQRNKEIDAFMINNDYVEYAFTGINSIYLDKTQLKGVE